MFRLHGPQSTIHDRAVTVEKPAATGARFSRSSEEQHAQPIAKNACSGISGARSRLRRLTSATVANDALAGHGGLLECVTAVMATAVSLANALEL